MWRNSHSLVRDDAIRATRLEIADDLSPGVDLYAAEDILGPGDSAEVGRVPQVAEMDVSANTNTASAALSAGTACPAAVGAASTSQTGTTAPGTPRLPLLGEEGASRAKGGTSGAGKSLGLSLQARILGRVLRKNVTQ